MNELRRKNEPYHYNTFPELRDELFLQTLRCKSEEPDCATPTRDVIKRAGNLVNDISWQCHQHGHTLRGL